MAIGKSLVRMLQPCAAALTLGLLSTGCGSNPEYAIDPTDIVYNYKVAFTEGEKSTGCYGDAIPANEKSDSSTFLSNTMFHVYASSEDEDTYYLEGEETTLQGFESDPGFMFTGTSVDVQYTMPDGTGDKITTTRTLTVEMDVDGVLVSGRTADETKFKCAGACTGTPIPSCTVTATFSGREIDGVAFEHDPG